MRLLIGWASNTSLRVRNTDTVRMLSKRTCAVCGLGPIVQLVLPATTSLIMLTVHSEWFALLVLMVLRSGFICDWRRSYVVRITSTLPQRLWHYGIIDRI